MVSTINATSTGVATTADNSAIIKVQSNGVTVTALAWVSFAGATGTVSGNYNVSSVTRNSLGNYTLNFTSALSDTKYVIAGSWGLTAVSTVYALQYITTSKATGSCVVTAYAFDPTEVSVVIFGNS